MKGMEGWWFEHSLSQFQVCLSADGGKNVSWSRLPKIWIYTYIYIYTHVITYRKLRLNKRCD